MEVYQRVAQQADGIVALHVAERLTSAIRLSRQAALEIEPLGVRVRVVETHTAASPEGFVVLAAARAAAQGATLDEVVAAAEASREHVGMYIAMQTLEHLRRGGRIGRAATPVTRESAMVRLARGRNCRRERGPCRPRLDLR